MSFENETQDFKIPHLRNEYQKVGMFGMPATPLLGFGGTTHQGDQVRGFGFLHDGAVDTLFRFHGSSVFSLNDTEQRQLEAFMLAFDSNLAPIVGQSITLSSTSPAAVGTRISLLIARAAAGECELTVKGTLAGEQRGWLRLGNGTFTSDRVSEAALTDATAPRAGEYRRPGADLPLRAARLGVARRRRPRRRTARAIATSSTQGAIPADPLSVPGGPTTTSTSTSSTTSTSTIPGQATMIPAKKLTLKDRTTPPADPSRRRFSFKAATRNVAAVQQGRVADAGLGGGPDDQRRLRRGARHGRPLERPGVHHARRRRAGRAAARRTPTRRTRPPRSRRSS
jgi:hypothetical protein